MPARKCGGGFYILTPVEVSLTGSTSLFCWLIQGHPELENLQSTYFQWLLGTGQDEKAGEVREREGDLGSAITLYMKAGLPAKAAKLVMHHQVYIHTWREMDHTTFF